MYDAIRKKVTAFLEATELSQSYLGRLANKDHTLVVKLMDVNGDYGFRPSTLKKLEQAMADYCSKHGLSVPELDEPIRREKEAAADHV